LGGPRSAGQIISSAAAPIDRLSVLLILGLQMFALDTSSFLPPDLAQSIAGYPNWLVITVGVLAVVLGVWILSKLLKAALYLVLIVLAVGCVCLAAWMVLSALHLLPGQPPSH